MYNLFTRVLPVGLIILDAPENEGCYWIKQPLLDGLVLRGPGMLTQYLAPWSNQCLALLGHNLSLDNYLIDLNNNYILIIYSNGEEQRYKHILTEIWQAKTPDSDVSDFKCRMGDGWSDVSRDGFNPWSSHEELFKRIYGGKYPLVIQTCVKWDNNPNGARKFLLCERVA